MWWRSDELSVGFSAGGVAGQRPKIREVLFFDTADFRFYNNTFILRRRIAHEDGFPIGEPEIVFKFRHPDIQKAADLDVRANIAGKYQIKFKSEALPLRDRIGGFRRLFSHNVEFELSQVHDEGDRASMADLARLFPPLAALNQADTCRVELVNPTIVEEVLQDLGELDFGKGSQPRPMWRYGVNGTTTCLSSESSRSSANTSVETMSTKRRRRSASSSLSRLSNAPRTGYPSERPRPAPSTKGNRRKPTSEDLISAR